MHSDCTDQYPFCFSLQFLEIDEAIAEATEEAKNLSAVRLSLPTLAPVGSGTLPPLSEEVLLMHLGEAEDNYPAELGSGWGRIAPTIPTVECFHESLRPSSAMRASPHSSLYAFGSVLGGMATLDGLTQPPPSTQDGTQALIALLTESPLPTQPLDRRQEPSAGPPSISRPQPREGGLVSGSVTGRKGLLVSLGPGYGVVGSFLFVRCLSGAGRLMRPPPNAPGLLDLGVPSRQLWRLQRAYGSGASH